MTLKRQQPRSAAAAAELAPFADRISDRRAFGKVRLEAAGIWLGRQDSNLRMPDPKPGQKWLIP